MLIGLLQNIALLVTIGIVCDFFWKKESQDRTIREKVVAGLLLGGIGIIIMLTPWVMVPGLVFDVRSIMLAGAGLFFGAIPTIIAMIITATYRIFMGGDGMYMGVSVILSAGSLGLVWRYARPYWQQKHPALELFLLGMLVHVAMLACIGLLPEARKWQTLQTIALPTLIVYPAGFLVYGYFLTNVTRYWQTRRDLVRSEERFREIIENSRDIHYRQEYESGIMDYISPSVFHILGYSANEVKTMSDAEQVALFHPQDFPGLKGFRDHIRDAKEKAGNYLEREFRMFHRDGGIRWIHGHYTLQMDGKGQPRAILGLLRDVTERRKQQDALEKSLREIERITSNNPNVIWKTGIDEQGQFHDSYLSQRADGILGLPPQSINNNLEVFFRYIHPDDSKRIRDAIHHAIENPGTMVDIEHKVIRADGVAGWFLTAGKVYTEEDGPRFYGYTMDITERKMADLALQQSEARFRSYVQAAPDGIFISDEMGKITDVNNAACLLTGYSREELLGTEGLGLFTEEERLHGLAAMDILRSEGELNDEFHFRRKDGTVFYGIFDAVRISTDQYLAFAKDINEMKRFQDELQRAKEKAEESDRLKSTFLATMSHELRTPLNAIIGFSELFDAGLPTAEVMKYASMINESGKHLLSIIESIFDIALLQSRESRIEIRSFTTRELMARVAEYLEVETRKHGKEHLLITCATTQEIHIETDWNKVIQVLRNLLSNAIKYTAVGSVTYGFEVRNRDLIFFVSDTGIGIPLDKQDIVFEQFRQADNVSNQSQGGVGLGLSICREIVALLKGDMRLESKEGVGTTIRFHLPEVVVETEPDVPVPQSTTKYPDFSEASILIVDDIVENLEYLKYLLTRCGASVLVASSGEEADRIVGEVDSLDLVLMDLKMPGMGGLNATRAILERRPTLPVIAQTAFALAGDADLAREYGCVDYLTKPIRRDEFFRKVGTVLEKARCVK